MSSGRLLLFGEIAAALWAELLKVRRSLLPWVTVAAFTVAGLVGGFFMFVHQDPERARSLGLLGAKAQFAGGTADWAGYFAFIAQIAAVGGLLVFGLVIIWLFGREFSDRTAKDLLALPTARSAVVAAKLIVAAGWCLLLTAQLIVLSLLLGAILGLPGWSADTALRGLGTVVATTLADRGAGYDVRVGGQYRPWLPRRGGGHVCQPVRRPGDRRARVRRVVPLVGPLVAQWRRGHRAGRAHALEHRRCRGPRGGSQCSHRNLVGARRPRPLAPGLVIGRAGLATDAHPSRPCAPPFARLLASQVRPRSVGP